MAHLALRQAPTTRSPGLALTSGRRSPETAFLAVVAPTAAALTSSLPSKHCNPTTKSSTMAAEPSANRLFVTARRSTTFKAEASPPSLPSRKRSEEHTSELQSRFDLVCRL